MNYPATSTQIARHLVNGATTNGGATITNLLKVPRSGYCVGLGGAEPLDPARSYMDQATAIVDNNLGKTPACAFGSWMNREAGEYGDSHVLYIEPVEIFSDEADALEAAEARGELAIYDLANGVEIRL